MTPWLHIVGIGEDGLDGLTPAARTVVEAAEVVIGGDRHHALSKNVTAERVAWPSPFDALIDTLLGVSVFLQRQGVGLGCHLAAAK